MAIPELPQDIIDLIIQIVAQIIPSNPEPLKTLSLVSRAFLPQSQRCLFHTVYLYQDPARHTAIHSRSHTGIHIRGRKLYALLPTSPHVFAYVRALVLRTRMTTELIWVVSTSEAAAIINACTELQTLELGSASVGINWRAMHRSMQSALTSVILSTQLSELTLANVQDIPPIILAAFKSFRALRLEQVTMNSRESQVGEDPARSTPNQVDSALTRLFIRSSNPFLRLLLGQKTLLSRLLVLDVAYTAGDPSLLRDLLHSVPRIEELRLSLLPNVFGDPQETHNTNIQTLPYLRRICLFSYPKILHETYSFTKHLIATAPALESAEVVATILGSMACLEAIHIWDDFYPDPLFQKLTLSFFLRQMGDYGELDDYLLTGFKISLSSVMRGKTQLPSLIKQGKMVIGYDIVDADFVSYGLDIKWHRITNP